MGRHAYPLSPEALAELKRFAEQGKRRHAVTGAPSSPSLRDIADHLFAQRLTVERVNAGVLWRACKRHGIPVPGRPGRCRTGKAHARRSAA
jgi:hypothetical protein